MSAGVPVHHGSHLASSSTTPKCLTKPRIFKVIVIGDSNVGKTCLSFRFCNGRFPLQTEATIGVDFRERTLTVEGETVRDCWQKTNSPISIPMRNKVQLWDTAGQEKYRQSMTAHYYRTVHAVVFVYDVTKPKTFANLAHWFEECRRYQVPFRNIPALLVGNKCDCKDQIMVNTNEAQKFADSLNLPLFETSAKADSEADHVEGIFMTLVHKLKECKTLALQEQPNNTIDVSAEVLTAEQESGYCC